MNDNNWGCLDTLIFLMIFVTLCLNRCDQVTEKEFNQKLKEWTQNQNVQLKQQNDSLYIILKEMREKRCE